MSRKKRIVLTGGGTAGHVSLNIALLGVIPKDYEVHYVGSASIEKDMVSRHAGIIFHTVLAGKLRRYISLQNLFDFFKVGCSIIQCWFLLLRLRPIGVFSKGGYVAVPVCVAAKLLGIPVVTHESDLTPGLATKIISKFAKKIFTSFEQTTSSFATGLAVHVGSPMRQELQDGQRDSGFTFTGLTDDKRPILLIMGGSLGAQKINEAVAGSLDQLLASFQVVHLTGRGKKIFDEDPPGYRSFEFVSEELKDIFAMTDVVVSRAGANSIFEFQQLHIPMLLIPLAAGSRGDQIDNAKLFASKGWAHHLPESELTPENFLQSVRKTHESGAQIIDAMKAAPAALSLPALWELIEAQFSNRL